MSMTIDKPALPSEVRDLRETRAPARSASKAEVYARAEQTMRRGKRLVVTGFVVAIAGIVGYCVACLGASLDQDLGAYLLDNPGPLIGPTLGTIGLGTLLWLVGSFIYLKGTMDSDPDGPDLHF